MATMPRSGLDRIRGLKSAKGAPLDQFYGKVAVTVPLGHEGPDPATFCDWTRLVVRTERLVGGLSVIEPLAAPIIHNREHIALRFLEGRAEWLFSVDGDMAFGDDYLCRMLVDTTERADMLFVSGTARMRTPDGKGSPTIFMADREGNLSKLEVWDTSKLFPVTAVGLFGFLVHRSVFEAVERPWFRYEQPGFGSGEDVAFCKAMGQKGFRVWVDGGLPFGHRAHYVLSGGPME